MQKLVITMIGVAMAGTVVCAQAGDADKGKAAFADHHCSTCHKTTKDDEKGGKMATVLADTVGKLSAADVKAWLTDTAAMEAKLPAKPKVLMSSYMKNQKLTDADVANLVAYLKTLPAK
jgi:cytochrome c2